MFIPVVKVVVRHRLSQSQTSSNGCAEALNCQPTAVWADGENRVPTVLLRNSIVNCSGWTRCRSGAIQGNTKRRVLRRIQLVSQSFIHCKINKRSFAVVLLFVGPVRSQSTHRILNYLLLEMNASKLTIRFIFSSVFIIQGMIIANQVLH